MRAFPLILVVALLSAGCLSGGALTGAPAPAFSFTTNEGTVVNATTYLGKYVVLDLMATWCAPCRLEVAHLREVQDALGDRVVILSVSVEPEDTLADLEAFEEKYGARWPYAIDRNLATWRAMDGRIIPKLVIIDPTGVVVFEREGEVLPAAIIRAIDPSLAPRAGAWIPAAGAALALGLVAPFNPYRRIHRSAPGRGAVLGALFGLAALGVLAWPLAGLASTRATYGSLFAGALSLGAVAWWALRARRKPAGREGALWLAASDRAYEMAPHFTGALVLALGASGALAFFAPLAAFLLGAGAAELARPRLAPRAQEMVGLGGLALAGIGLLAFGARVLVA